MKDGVLKLTFFEGGITSVSVGTGLDVTYARLFEAACVEARSEASVDAGVKVVLFGCFWIEAVCNECLRELLKGAFLSEAVLSALWKALERVRAGTKLEILASVHPTQVADTLKRASGLFELRNRLAHFKEAYIEVPGPYVIEDG